MLAAASAAAPADTAGDLAARFGKREAVLQMSLSPNGKQIAILAPFAERGAVVQIADLEAGSMPRSILRSSGDPDRLTGCRWVTDDRLVCTLLIRDSANSSVVYFSRLLTVSSAGGDAKVLTARAKNNALGWSANGGRVIDYSGTENGTVLMSSVFVPESTTGNLSGRSLNGLGVERVDIASLARKIVEQPKASAVGYISDGRGSVRVMGLNPTDATGYDATYVNYLFRAAGDREWQRLSRVEYNGVTSSGFDPEAVDSDKDVVYGFDGRDGFRALYSRALKPGAEPQLLLSRPDADVDALIRIGRQQRVVGASYATDKRIVEFFDPELKKLGQSLTKALPGQPSIDFVDASADESKLLLFAGGDNNPGAYYLYDKATHKLAEILADRPELAKVALATQKPITYPAADGTQIPAYLTLPAGSDGKNLPAIVMPHGGPNSRDEWGFDWLVQFFAARGYAVLQPNYRGSIGFGVGFAGKGGFQEWRRAIGDVDDAGRWLTKQGIAAPGKMAIVGWSYGGYAALQSAVLDPGLYKAVVAVAPVTDLEQLRRESVGYANYKYVDQQIGKGPHVQAGSPAQNAEAIQVPVLMFHGDKDVNVDVAESHTMVARLRRAGKDVTYVEFPGLDHQLPDDAARTRLLGDSDAFLRKALGL